MTTISSKTSARVTSKRESLAGHQTKTVQETRSLRPPTARVTSDEGITGRQPQCTSGHVHLPSGRQGRHNHRTKTCISCIYKATGKDCGHTRSHKGYQEHRELKLKTPAPCQQQQQKGATMNSRTCKTPTQFMCILPQLDTWWSTCASKHPWRNKGSAGPKNHERGNYS